MSESGEERHQGVEDGDIGSNEPALSERMSEETTDGLGLDLPEDPEEAIAVLRDEVGRCRAEAEGRLNDLKRLAADFDNFRKRVNRDSGESATRGVEKVVRNLLPTLDTFDAALNVAPSSPTEEKLLDGLRSTHAQLLRTLEDEGLEVIDASSGSRFDPEVHEAVMTSPGENMVISSELRRGYRLKDRVVRASLVALGPAEAEDESEDEPEAQEAD